MCIPEKSGLLKLVEPVVYDDAVAGELGDVMKTRRIRQDWRLYLADWEERSTYRAYEDQ